MLMGRKKVETAEDVMIRRVEMLAPGVSVHEAVRILMKRGYAALPVTDGEGKLLGVFSEHDCIRVLADAVYQGWPTGTVAGHMATDPVVVAPADPLLVVVQRFGESRHRSLPVTSDGKVVGLIVRGDLMRALDRKLEAEPTKTTYELMSDHRT